MFTCMSGNKERVALLTAACLINRDAGESQFSSVRRWRPRLMTAYNRRLPRAVQNRGSPLKWGLRRVHYEGRDWGSSPGNAATNSVGLRNARWKGQTRNRLLCSGVETKQFCGLDMNLKRFVAISLYTEFNSENGHSEAR